MAKMLKVAYTGRGVYHRFLTFLLVASSGIPLFYKDPVFEILMVVVTPALIYAYFVKNSIKRVPRFIVWYLLLYTIVSAGQAITFSFFSISTYLGFLLRLLFTFFILKTIGKKIVGYYIDTIYVLSLISFVFYVPGVLIPGFEKFMINNVASAFSVLYSGPEMYRPHPNIGIFTFCIDFYKQVSIFPRNAGPFWEPGAFGGFLLLATIFNSAASSTFWSKKNKVFFLAIITTFSTTAFIGLALFLFGFYAVRVRNVKALVLAPLIVILSISAYNTIPFLKAKVEEHVLNVELNHLTDQKRTRAVSALLDFQDIMKYPLFGRGKNIETRYDGFSTLKDVHRNNGTSALAVNFGVFAFFLYFFMCFKSFKRLLPNSSNVYAFYLIILLLVLGSSEAYFLKPMFLLLTMLHVLWKPKKVA